MEDLLLVVEAFLDAEGIAHQRDETGEVTFDLPFGRTSYRCEVGQSGRTLTLAALWIGRIPSERGDSARELLTRLSNTASRSGDTFLSPHRGQLKYFSSVDLSQSHLTVERVSAILETLLDPFNVKVLAMSMVFDGELSADAAVNCYAEWDRKRLAALMYPFSGKAGDSSMN